jgi:hypothetical protein
MSKKLIIKPLIVIALIFLSVYGLSAQCGDQVFHDSGSQTINGIQVTVTSSGQSGLLTDYCPDVTQPYLIGLSDMDGSYTFQFSPSIDALTLNFSGIHDDLFGNKEIIKLMVNGSHYSIPSIGLDNGCDDLAVLTPLGNITGSASGWGSGWNGTTITGPISQITVMDSVVSGFPNAAVFSLFICAEHGSSVWDVELPELVVYPIPANNDISISGLTNENINVKLFDQFGRLKFIRRDINKSNALIDLAGFPNGIYYMSIFDGENLITKKVIVKKE